MVLIFGNTSGGVDEGGGGSSAPFARVFITRTTTTSTSDESYAPFASGSVTQTGDVSQIDAEGNDGHFALQPGVYSFAVRMESANIATQRVGLALYGGGVLTSGNRSNTYVNAVTDAFGTYFSGTIVETITNDSPVRFQFVGNGFSDITTTVIERLTITRIGNLT